MAEADGLIRLALFGHPVAHSLSPRIHRAFAEQGGMAVDYRAVDVEAGEFPAALDAFAAAGGRGCNITAPLKHEAWRMAGGGSHAAEHAGAANTLTRRPGGGWYADNTDGAGLIADLDRHDAFDAAAKGVLLLGAGGAAAGVLATLMRRCSAPFVIANRSPERAERLALEHASLGLVSAVTLEALASSGPWGLVLNATSSGHEGGAPPVVPDWFAPGGLCYDLNYGPASAPLRQRCGRYAIPYADGLGMLVAQAAESFRLWTGLRPDLAPVIDAMREHA